jgi:hypothetical protein
MLAIIPILIKVAAGALTKGSTKVIAKWAGGSIAKKYIATKVSEKVIDEARKMASGESKDWQAAFKEDPSNALRDAATDFVKAEARDALHKLPPINETLIRVYNDTLINNTGSVVYQESRSMVAEPKNFVVKIDPEKIINRTISDVISRGLEWTQNKDVIGGESQLLDRNVIGGGSSVVLNRQVIGISNPIESRQVLEEVNQIESVDRITTSDILESAGKTAFYDSFDERNLTYTVIGTDDALAGRVRSPLEALMEKVFDINEPAS